LVSTVSLPSPVGGFETMVFRCTPNGTVLDWSELTVRRYIDEQSARDGHVDVVNTYRGTFGSAVNL
jgi:hypothetical protein